MSLDTAAQIAVDKGQPSLGIALTLVLEDLSIRRLEQEGREALHRLSLGGLRILGGINQADLAGLSIHLNRAGLGELGELGLHSLAVRTPIGIIHCKCIHGRAGARLVLKSLGEPRAKKEHRHERQKGNCQNDKQNHLPIHLEERASFFTEREPRS